MFKQYACSKIGQSGCYFLSLVKVSETIAKKDIDVLAVYDKGIKEGWMDDECFMKNPAAMVAHLTGKKIDVRHDKVGYAPKENEYEITRYELKETGRTFSHFVVTRNGKVVYDPYGDSRTRRLGKAESLRIVCAG
ncbi:MAG: DUF261 family protein [Treponema sp.]